MLFDAPDEAGGLFRSWFMGGFEGATMMFDDGRRVDVIEGSGHAGHAERDYRLLRSAGIATVRDALRWHLIEPSPGHYDWSSFLPMLRASRAAGTQVIWDLCHFGLPDWVDPWSGDFVERFADFSREAARIVANETDEVPFWCPVNEISYWSFAGGSMQHFQPFGHARGWEWKRQLVRAALASMDSLRDVDRRARFVHTDPVIHIVADDPDDIERAESYREAMFEAWDMIGGLRDTDLGGAPAYLDIIGVNFYFNNEWVHNGPRLQPSDPRYRRFSDILAEVKSRYDRPIIISETGHEGANGPQWLADIMADIRVAATDGVAVEGLCLYPVMDYPGWTDDRHCDCGVIDVAADWTDRSLNAAMAGAVRSAAAGLKSKENVPA